MPQQGKTTEHSIEYHVHTEDNDRSLQDYRASESGASIHVQRANPFDIKIT